MPDIKQSQPGHNKQGNVLAFDYGLRHIGVAVGQTLTGQARGVATLRAKQGKVRWQEIEQLIEEYSPLCVVVGFPLNMDGSTSDMSSLAEQFAQQFTRRYALPSYMQDERLTSYVAQDMLADARALGLGKNDHEIAACLIAQQYLNES